MPRDVLVHGNLVLADRVVTGTLTIRDEQILAIVEEARPPTSTDGALVDASGKYVLPGGIEVHGHMRIPGAPHKEDYSTGSMAALAGGVTTILDMPNTQPPTTTRLRLEEKLGLASGNTYCDYGVIFGASNDNFAELQQVDRGLIVGVKFFMAGHETTPTTITNLGNLYRAFEILGNRDLTALVHAENQQLIDHLSLRYIGDGDADGLAYSCSRGEVVTAVAMLEAMEIAHATGTRLYVCHVSTPSELDALRFAKARRQQVYGEVAWYHLLFSTDDYGRLGTRIKVSPAIRTPGQQSRLWDVFVNEDLIDTLCAEHSPHLLSEKADGFAKAASGMPGIQEYRAAVLTKMIRDDSEDVEAALIKVAKMTSTHVARIFGLSHKGALECGKDADVVVLDPYRPTELLRESLFAKCGWSGCEGQQLIGVPELTMLRGKVVYANGAIQGSPTGRLINRQLVR